MSFLESLLRPTLFELGLVALLEEFGRSFDGNDLDGDKGKVLLHVRRENGEALGLVVRERSLKRDGSSKLGDAFLKGWKEEARGATKQKEKEEERRT